MAVCKVGMARTTGFERPHAIARAVNQANGGGGGFVCRVLRCVPWPGGDVAPAGRLAAGLMLGHEGRPADAEPREEAGARWARWVEATASGLLASSVGPRLPADRVHEILGTRAAAAIGGWTEWHECTGEVALLFLARALELADGQNVEAM